MLFSFVAVILFSHMSHFSTAEFIDGNIMLTYFADPLCSQPVHSSVYVEGTNVVVETSLPPNEVDKRIRVLFQSKPKSPIVGNGEFFFFTDDVLTARTNGSCQQYTSVVSPYQTLSYSKSGPFPPLPTIELVTVDVDMVTNEKCTINMQLGQCLSCSDQSNPVRYSVLIRSDISLIISTRSLFGTYCSPYRIQDVQFVSFETLDDLNNKVVAIFLPDPISGEAAVVTINKNSHDDSLMSIQAIIILTVSVVAVVVVVVTILLCKWKRRNLSGPVKHTNTIPLKRMTYQQMDTDIP